MLYRKVVMNTPYGLPIIDGCVICKLRSSGFFCDLPVETLADLEKIKHSSAHSTGSILFVEGQETRGVFVICTGRVKLSLNSREGKTLIVRLALPGDILGLRSAISGTPYELTAETLQPSQVEFIRKDDFAKFLETHGDACLNAAKHLSTACDSAYETIRSLGLTHSVAERLARLLLEWSEDGEHTKEGIRVAVALTHLEIAQLIGTTRETVTRTLSDFRKRNIAEMRGATVIIHDRIALQALLAA